MNINPNTQHPLPQREPEPEDSSLELPFFMNEPPVMEAQQEMVEIVLPPFNHGPLPLSTNLEISTLELPQFTENLSPFANSQEPFSMELPLPHYTTEATLHPLPSINKAFLWTPNFSTMQMPERPIENKITLQSPHFSPFPFPHPHPDLRNFHLNIPRFSPNHPPDPIANTTHDLPIPSFRETSYPRHVGFEAEHTINLPAYRFASLPIPPLTDELQIELPHFSPSHSPLPQESSEAELPLPAFSTTAIPISKFYSQKTLGNRQPTLSKRLISYDEIFEMALKYGTVGDIRTLKRHSRMDLKHTSQLFDQLIRHATSLLPQSTSFSSLIENDQEQIDLLTEFCRHLIQVEQVENLSLRQNSILELFNKSGPHTLIEDTIRREKLIELKNYLYCFLTEILLQEQSAAQKFNAPQKNLNGLVEALPLLASQIQKEAKAIRMERIRHASEKDFSLWENRKPVQHSEVRPENPGTTVDVLEIDKGLRAIQSPYPKFSQVQDVTSWILSLPETNTEEASIKGNYLLNLAKNYLLFTTIPSLNRAISWVELAITTLTGQVAENDSVLLACYECRGIAWQKISQLLKEINKLDDHQRRQRLDESYRDFYKSHSLRDGQENNIVRKVKQGQQHQDIDLAVKEIDEAVKIDEDYAEGHYHRFLKVFEKNELDRSQIIHDQFSRLKTVSSSHLFEEFGKLLKERAKVKVTLPRGSAEHNVFKITLSSGSAYLKLDAEGIYLSQAGTDFLKKMLTNGIQKIRVWHPYEKKPYFNKLYPKAKLNELVKEIIDTQSRLNSIEEGIKEFHAFEISSFYKSSIEDKQHPLSANSIRNRIDSHLIHRLIDLHTYSMKGYMELGRTHPTNGSKEHYATALLYACRAIRDCDRLEDQTIIGKKIDLLIQRSIIYKQLNLINNEARDLEEAVALSKIHHSIHPTFHYNLGLAYQRLNRLEEALDQLMLVQSISKTADYQSSKPVYRKTKVNRKKVRALQHTSQKKKSISAKAALEIEKIKTKLATKSQAPHSPSADPQHGEIIAQFQDKNILEECIQVIHDHRQANYHLNDPLKKVPFWDLFVQNIYSATTMKELSEIVLSSILLSDKVTSKNLLKLANVSNLQLSEADLEQMKGYVEDAIKAYHESKAKIVDQCIEEAEKAKKDREQQEAYYKFKELLKTKLKEGERIRPGSLKRDKILDLVSGLSSFAWEKEALLTALGEILDEPVAATLPIINQEIVEILSNALEKEIKPYKIKDNVLHIYGNNVFLSHIKELICKLCKNNKKIYDVHIMGINVYIDTCLDLPGVNVAIGGEYGEFLMDKGLQGLDTPPKKITLNLSGTKGEDGLELTAGAASNGRHLCDDGDDGLPGNMGIGGDPGGDFCLNCKTLKGFNADIIELINLEGGIAGKGSKGQAGGKGADGIQGTDGRRNIQKGDPADSDWGFIDIRRGGRGRPAGSGGKGGDGGVGGKGGLSGEIFLENELEPLTDQIKKGNGADGDHGDPGEGGKAGTAKPDGLDCALVKGGGWIFSGHDEVIGYDIDIRDHDNDRRKEGWYSRYTKEETISRNQGREKGRGQTVEEHQRRRDEKEKHDLKRELFNTNLGHHIHTESAEARVFAFDEVTNKLAVSRENEKIKNDQLSSVKNELKDVETLIQTTASILHQAKTQQNAQTQHSRTAQFTQTDKIWNLKAEVSIFFNNKQKDESNILSFWTYSPVHHDEDPFIVHELECAMHEVNLTHGQNMRAMAKLIAEIKHLPAEKTIEDKRTLLLNKLADLIEKAPLKYAYIDFDYLLKESIGLTIHPRLTSVIQTIAPSVEQFQNEIKLEKEAINHAYDIKSLENITLSGILNFLSKDRLFHSLLTNNFTADVKVKKEKWFQERLYQKVSHLLRTFEKREPTHKQIDFYLNYIQHKKIEIQNEIVAHDTISPSKTFQKILFHVRKTVKDQLKKLKREQEWMLDHLIELHEAHISPKRELELGSIIEDVYQKCSKEWVNIPSTDEKASSPSADVPPEEQTLSSHTIQTICKENWNEAKKLRLEKQIKQLTDLNLNNSVAYLNELALIYSDALYNELASVFVAHVTCYKDLLKSQSFLNELKTESVQAIYQLRMRDWNSDPSLPEQEQLVKEISTYLQNRHLSLIQKECFDQLLLTKSTTLSQEEFNQRLTVLKSYFYTANKLFRLKEFLPNVDFLSITKDLILQNRDNIGANHVPSSSIQIPPIEENFIHSVLKRSVEPLIGEVDLNNHTHLIEEFERALSDQKKADAYLFLIANLNPTYSKILKMIDQLLPIQTDHNPNVKMALYILNQKAEAQHVNFELHWKEVTAQARFLDKVRLHILQETPFSIEKTLYQIAEEANFLTPDEKIVILYDFMKHITFDRSFTCINDLKTLQNRLIAKVGLFSIEGNSSQEVSDYNQKFKAAFETVLEPQGLEELPALFLKAISHSQHPLPASFIALNHLPFETDQLIILYKHIELLEFSENEEGQLILKKRCLNSIKERLLIATQTESQKLMKQKKEDKIALFNQQKELINKASDLIKNCQILHPDTHIGKLELWIMKLDHYYEIVQPGDVKGEERKRLYTNALEYFLEQMRSHQGETAIVHFNDWLRKSFNDMHQSRVTLEKIQELLEHLQSPQADVKTAALNKLDNLYWRGIIPYFDPQNNSSLLTLLEGKEWSEEIGKKFKLKFDDAAIHDEYAQIRNEIQLIDQERQLNVVDWLKRVEDRVSSEETTGTQLEEIYPSTMILKKAIEDYIIPVLSKADQDPENLEEKQPEEDDISVSKWFQSLLQKTPAEYEKTIDKVNEYLDDLESSLTLNHCISTDKNILNDLKIFITQLNRDDLKDTLTKIALLEIKLIDYFDKKENIIHQFYSKLFIVNHFREQDLLLDDPIHRHVKKEFENLKCSLSSCRAILGEENFFAFVDRLMDHLNTDQDPLKFEMVTHLFWVLPRLSDPSICLDVMKNRLSTHWALTLLESHCLESISPALSEMITDFPTLNIHHLDDGQKDAIVSKTFKSKKEDRQNCLKSFNEAISNISTSPFLRSGQKETLLRMIAERLSLLNQGKMEFSIEDFTHLLAKYLGSPSVLKKLSHELSIAYSPIIDQLLQPSFESFRYALTLLWIKGNLEPAILKLEKSIRQKLFDSLFQIEALKKEGLMLEVVESLKGDLMTPAVVDCITHFAQGTFELDQETLNILKNRTISGEWYQEIDRITKFKRSKPRDLDTLISLMKQESAGINSSIESLLSGENSQLKQDILEIREEFDKVKNWTDIEIKQWASENKGKGFLNDPKNLKIGIAVVSRASQFLGKDPKKDFRLRDTQLIALWLMLRPTQSVDKGRICQMFTGEGKSITFTGLAILRAMTGSYVDIITTSFVLAARDAENKKPMYDLFDMTVSNNCDKKSDDDEEERKKRYFKDGKPVDIIYGDVASFERDLLLTEFHGKNIIEKSRLGDNRSVLVDEVDGLFLDNAGMVLYLSHNVDSLRYLERVFAHIWMLANQPPFANAMPYDDKYVDAIQKMMQEKIKSGELTLPNYEAPHAKYIEMKSIIERKLSQWIRSALYAKVLRINNEYIITDQGTGNKQRKAVTVMDKGTGVEQFSLKWSNGLHQFLQFKHGLEPSPDSLKAVFLSNYFYFKSYGQHIYGLSGTLGSNTEQKYLQELYQIDLCKIPRFKSEKYIQHNATVTSDTEEWLKQIEISLKKQLNELKKAGLIICDSLEDVATVQEYLKHQFPQLQIYTRTNQELAILDNINKVSLKPGDLLIATNLAGRGTDLETNTLLEAHGGLHVILSYFPQNIRIQEQAFGRTARAGNEGSGEFIIMDPQYRSLTELARERDLNEKQRLENVAIKDVKKIEFENELLRGFYHKGKKITGFQSLLNTIQRELGGNGSFYQKAQLDSLKNRWAFWIDQMDEKISLVHIIGKESVVTAFNKFEEGVLADFNSGGFRLIKEPSELIKLGGEYRRAKQWSEAEKCYDEASKDPHYDYVRYYKAACHLIQHPTSSLSAKLEFKKEAKKAAASIKPEIEQLQMSVQSISQLVEERRVKAGDADYGNPYKARSEEKIQIWSIFLSAIDGAIGGTLSEEAIKKSPFVSDGNHAKQILESLGDHYKWTRLSKKLRIDGESITYKGKPLEFPKMFKSVFSKLKTVRRIDKQALKGYCHEVITQGSAKDLLGCPAETIFKLSKIPPTFEGWPADYTEGIKFVLSTVIEELQEEKFASHDVLKQKLEEKKASIPLLSNVVINDLFTALNSGKLVVEDCILNLSDRLVRIETPPLQFKTSKDLKDGFTTLYESFPEALQHALLNACRDRKVTETGLLWTLKSSIYLSDLALPKTTDEATDILWGDLEDKGVIKPPKIKLQNSDFKKQSETIKERLKTHFRGNEKLDEAVDDIFKIIDNSFGMIYKLDNKKASAEFADIIRKYFHDHRQHAPEGLGFFIELGLEVIADLIEKKDPPEWYEVVAVTAMGVAQMVAGVIIKAYLPVVGELIGNALISSGMDDVMFAITSAINGEFSWSDYADHKVESLKRSIISSAITCGVSFGVSSIQLGSVSKAWDVQKLSGIEKAIQAGKIAPDAFNLGTHILKEVGRSFISTGISQLASRGLHGMAKLISSSYEKNVSEEIKNTVNAHWHLVQAQAKALFEKLHGDESVKGNIDSCINLILKKVTGSNFFDGVIRGSKQVIPQVGSLIGGGWGEFISHAPDIANLGVSIPKLINLVEDSINQLSREIRETKNRKEEIAQPTRTVTLETFEQELESKKSQFASQLTDAFNGILNGAVYAPLISKGTQYLIDKSKEALIPLSEQEKVAQSAYHLSKIIDTQNDVNKAFYDEDLRRWKGADDEVTELSDEEQEKNPVNATDSIKDLKHQYGSLLKIYKDKEGHLYVQRPSRLQYAQGIIEGKASGDPEIIALAKVVGKNISIRSADGKIKTYSMEGTVVSSDQGDNDPRKGDTIYLKIDHDKESGIGHVVPDKVNTQQNQTGPNNLDCLYEAVRQETGRTDPIHELRNMTANELISNDHCKRHYHDWSLSSETKKFVGEIPAYVEQAPQQDPAWNLGISNLQGLVDLGSLKDLSSFIKYGPKGIALLPLGASKMDKAYVGAHAAIGEKSESGFTQMFKSWGLSKDDSTKYFNKVNGCLGFAFDGLGIVGGALSIPASGGATAVLAASLGTLMVDNFIASGFQCYSGEIVKSKFQTALETTLSQEQAALINDSFLLFGPGIVHGVGALEKSTSNLYSRFFGKPSQVVTHAPSLIPNTLEFSLPYMSSLPQVNKFKPSSSIPNFPNTFKEIPFKTWINTDYKTLKMELYHKSQKRF